DEIFGHAYGKGTLKIPVGGATITMQGETVIDLDANRDGTFVNLGQAVSNFFSGTPLPTALADMRYGSNSTLSVSAEVPALSFLGTLNLPVAQATSFISATGMAF